MNLDDIQDEAQYQKLQGMPRYPSSGKRSGCKTGFVIFVIIIIIGAIIFLAKSGLKFFQ